MRSSLLASVDVTEFQATEAYSSLDLTKVRYSVYKHSREENLNVMERIIQYNNNNNNNNNNDHNTNIEVVSEHLKFVIFAPPTSKIAFGSL
jgi:hypothetical protein